MKRSLKIAAGILIVLTGLYSCENGEVNFPDFDYTSSYFPYQYPVRTLVLGEYVFDNTNDNNLRFLISVTMGGIYKNNEDRIIEFVVDETLTDNLYIGTQRVLPLPASYYTLSHDSQIIIPKGEYYGAVTVQLTEAFLNDPLAVGSVGTKYAVPLRITGASTDSVHSGQVAVGVLDPDPRVTAHWIVTPKNFTLFGINYVNEYQGKYLKRGASQVFLGAELIETNVYRTPYVEKDEVVEIKTASRHAIIYRSRIERSTSPSPGSFEMLITFDENGNGIITKSDVSSFNVSGSAKYAKNAEEWGQKARNAIYLDYVVNDGTYLHTAKDTLVFRDRGIGFQEYAPVVIP
jgi:hypothetical protein